MQISHSASTEISQESDIRKAKKRYWKILRTLCDYKHVEIIEAHAMPDHIHMLVSIPPKLAVADFMGYLKGKSTLMIFERHANLKYKYGRRVFWAKGYYVNTQKISRGFLLMYGSHRLLRTKFLPLFVQRRCPARSRKV